MKRGEVWHVDLSPSIGKEQRGGRYVLIVSPDAFNRITGRAVVVPITLGGVGPRNQGFAVSLTGAGTNAAGVVLCDQPRTLDLQARGGKRVEVAPDFIVDEVLAKLSTLFE